METAKKKINAAGWQAVLLFLVVALSLICGFTIFLSEYLLYRYDQEE